MPRNLDNPAEVLSLARFLMRLVEDAMSTHGRVPTTLYLGIRRDPKTGQVFDPPLLRMLDLHLCADLDRTVAEIHGMARQTEAVCVVVLTEAFWVREGHEATRTKDGKIVPGQNVRPCVSIVAQHRSMAAPLSWRAEIVTEPGKKRVGSFVETQGWNGELWPLLPGEKN